MWDLSACPVTRVVAGLSCWRSSSCLQVLLPDLHWSSLKSWLSRLLSSATSGCLNIDFGKKHSCILVGYQMLSKKKQCWKTLETDLCISTSLFSVPFSLILSSHPNSKKWSQHLSWSMDYPTPRVQSWSILLPSNPSIHFQAFIQAPRKFLQYLHDFGDY